MDTDYKRDEQTAKMLREYRAELESLTDIEFWEHWRTSTAMKNMTDAQWEEAMKGKGIRL